MHTAELVVRGQVFEEEGLHVADVGAEGGDVVVFWVAEGEFEGMEGGFFAGGVDGDDVGAGGEGGGAEEGEEVVGEEHPRIVEEGEVGVEAFGGLCASCSVMHEVGMGMSMVGRLGGKETWYYIRTFSRLE
jgi:hypothetical protein